MRFFLFSIVLFSVLSLNGQTIIIGSTDDAQLRVLQLIGKVPPNYSFTSRPYSQKSFTKSDSLITPFKNFLFEEKGKKLADKKRVSLSLLPVYCGNQYNSFSPFGWNDGAMIPAKGYQTFFRAGIYSEIGPLSIQLQPEYIYAMNPSFEKSLAFGDITTPNFSKLYPGQSSIRLNSKNISFGVSTENLWWGPGVYNSLLMSNNAPGFLHLTFNTTKPVKTFIGSFEWRLVSGILENDSRLLSQNTHLHTLPLSLVSEKRYMNGLTLSWQPKWVKGLFLGVNRVFQVYKKDLTVTSGFVDTYLPVFGNIFKKSVSGGSEISEDAKKRDQLISLFTRWVFPKVNAECYFEYGWNDHSYNNRDFIMSPTHSAAYLVGMKKIFPLKQNLNENIELGIEYTHMSQSPDYIVREAGNWYVHDEVKEGYTNNGQILGAGSGLGNKYLTFSMNYRKELKLLGFRVDKIQNDPLESYHPYLWEDYAFTVHAGGDIKNFYLMGKLQIMKSKNYGWEDKNRYNVQTMLSINYYL